MASPSGVPTFSAAWRSASSPCCRRTTSPPRLSPQSCARKGPSAQTCRAPAPRSTGSSPSRVRRWQRTPHWAIAARSGSPHRAGSVIAVIEHPVLEHRTTRGGRWLRRNRTRVAFWIAVVEGALLVFGAIDRWGALLVAVLVIAAYFVIRPRLQSPLGRDVLWTAAVSQALVPILVIVVGTVALIAVGIIAVVALIVLFGDRR